MKKQISFYVPLMFILISCKEKEITTAKIIERKTVNNKVLIKYTFIQNNKPQIDSEIVANTIVPHDSLKLEIDGTNHKLLIP